MRLFTRFVEMTLEKCINFDFFFYCVPPSQQITLCYTIVMLIRHVIRDNIMLRNSNIAIDMLNR